MKFKNYSQWVKINESENYEVKFPWDEEIFQTVESVKDELNFLESYELNRYKSSKGDTVSFNIRLHDFPDAEEIAKKYNLLEDEVDEMWNDYVQEKLTNFIDSIDYAWVEEAYQEGRSGGWLTIVIKNSYSTEETLKDLQEIVDEYVYDVKDIAPTTKEELHKLRHFSAADKFGLGGSGGSDDRAKELKLAETWGKKVMDKLEEGIEALREWKSQLEEIGAKIEKGLKSLTKDFDSYIHHDRAY